MGACTSRTFLLQSGKYSESPRHSGRKVQPIFETDRLVRYELRKEVQYHFPHKIREARDSLSIIQVAPKSV